MKFQQRINHESVSLCDKLIVQTTGIGALNLINILESGNAFASVYKFK